MVAEEVTETGSRSGQTSPVIKAMVPTGGGVYSVLTCPQWLLNDGIGNLDTFLVNEIVAQMLPTLERAVISGSGSSQPKGLIHVTPSSSSNEASPQRDCQALQYIASGDATMIPHGPNDSPVVYGGDVLLSTVAALRVPYRARARWLMSRSTMSTIAQWKDTQGRYLLQPGLQGEADRLLGYPVIISDSMSDEGSNT
jgi:HK97 family phage major capsid protein